MKIRVNGEDVNFGGETVLDLIEQYKLKKDRIVVEKNREIVHREEYGNTTVVEGDVIEIVRFVGGG